MPLADCIFARFAGQELFAKLDLSEAYTQLELDEEIQLLAAVNTFKALFAVIRLSYGTSASSQIFQRKLDRLLSHVTHVATYISTTSLLAAKIKSSFLRHSIQCSRY